MFLEDIHWAARPSVLWWWMFPVVVGSNGIIPLFFTCLFLTSTSMQSCAWLHTETPLVRNPFKIKPERLKLKRETVQVSPWQLILHWSTESDACLTVCVLIRKGKSKFVVCTWDKWGVNMIPVPQIQIDLAVTGVIIVTFRHRGFFHGSTFMFWWSLCVSATSHQSCRCVLLPWHTLQVSTGQKDKADLQIVL